jgi:transcriptional regulator with XRE-family HTH domain
VDVSLVISRRLTELGLDQKDLARAANVTESYISQLLTRKRPPPSPGRTDIYEKMGRYLNLPKGKLARLADAQRKEQQKRSLGEEPAPLFPEVRALVLRKCNRDRVKAVRAIFEKQPFGELERLVTQKLLDVAKWDAREEMENEYWLRMIAQGSGRSYEEIRVVVLDFLDTNIFQVSLDNCVAFLDPILDSWGIDLVTFDLTIVLNHPVTPGQVKQFGFIEREPEEILAEVGLTEFLRDASLSGTATRGELEFLKRLKFRDQRPTALYYYRELQNLRDPLHFRSS